MNRSEVRQIVLALFSRRRRAGLILGVGELLAALQAVDGNNWGLDTEAELRGMLEVLWCNSAEESREFGVQWENVVSRFTKTEGLPTTPEEVPEQCTEPEAEPPVERPLTPQDTSTPRPTEDETQPGWDVLPIKTPLTLAHLDELPNFHSYGPVSARFMAYAWRYLRRPRPDGPADILDIPATVTQAARQGFFIAPVYHRRERNHAHLLLLIDQNGSMMPFHRFNRDLVNTARHESTLMQLDIFYFHNLVAQNVYLDSHLTHPVEISSILSQCTTDTVILIVSDAGAARGYRNSRRIRETAIFLARFKRVAAQVAWLNPMPRVRWEDSSAEMIERFVPMYQMDPEGMSHAVDVLRGQFTGQR
jgi:hypothetical protein